ncbi:expressed unknown protein [Seminavis robusta]|uniref:Uncharacterized protein n=1 Tax=Seminavis robusta TaxID=568900 RepID=A0A9N8EWN3_9STRA|nr:expressed unknown protein [Seminavis robusta]|eukprot:Sro1823_g299930.1 n/a (230) ;mRNA; r:13889-14578
MKAFATILFTITTLFVAVANADLHRASIYAFGGADPHITTWSGDRFEFQRRGDFVLLSNPDYSNGLGLEVQVRTKVNDWWSYIEAAVLRIGDETVEVRGGEEYSRYWINGEEGFSALEPQEEMQVWLQQGGIEVHIRQVNSKQFQLRVDLGNDEGVVFETFQQFVRVDVQANDAEEKSFASNSLGLVGSFPRGAKVGRDKTTVIRSSTKFAKEWMVPAAETTETTVFRS